MRKNNQEENHDMFGFDDISLEDLEKVTDEEEMNRWPETMRHMYDLLKAELEAEGYKTEVALRQLYIICKHFGGIQNYLPKGRVLEGMMTELRIWNEYKGNNVLELAQKHDVSTQHIYRVIARMRKREAKKRQPDLFLK